MTDHMPVSRDFPPFPSPDEIKKLYPSNLELLQVQVLFRHGERTPVRARFQTWGLQPFWPFCKIAERFTQTIVSFPNEAATPFEYVRRLESVARELPKNVPVPASGFKPGEHDGLCMLGELTDLGRLTGFKLGEKLRRLYVDELKFLPQMFADHSDFYFRSSHVARSNETLLSLFQALYPTTYRAPGLKPVIYTRLFPQENAYPNDENCKRLSELGFMFAEIVAHKWNPVLAGRTSDLLRDVLPNGVAIDGSPARPASSTPSPPAWLTTSHSRTASKTTSAVIEEWYLGVQKSKEYRTLAVGALAGDFLHRIKLAVAGDQKAHGINSGSLVDLFKGSSSAPKEQPVKLALYGSHDTTIASLLCALDAFDNKWPPFTSDLTFELFAKPSPSSPSSSPSSSPKNPRDYYVRLSYNDEILHLPACASPGTNLDGDSSFCALAAFSAAVDEFVPQNWELGCRSNLNKTIVDAPEMDAAFKAIPRVEGAAMQKQQA
ncbi:histidine phosphatase superfamily [Myxozyma melibiosi]|uniref:Histidine phosphatase superfamily n=1 Tax=Myxozyma melibiosi TaxID=54550 RepID=A0ABR1EYL6_9ASCO